MTEPRASDDDLLASAKQRGSRFVKELLATEGGTISAADVARILDISPSEVERRRNERRLLTLQVEHGGYVFPVWQFDAKFGTLPGINAVLHALSGHDSWMQLTFMLNPCSELDERVPLHALRNGEHDAVLRAARLYGEHGAA